MGWTIWIILGAVFGALGVGMGAFGAHALKSSLTPENMDIFQTASRYHLIHAVALIAVGLVAVKIEGPALAVAGTAMTIGIIVFCGSLYTLATFDLRWLGAVAPIGGVALIVGWLALAWAATPW